MFTSQHAAHAKHNWQMQMITKINRECNVMGNILFIKKGLFNLQISVK